MTDAIPHSPDYLKRKADREKESAYWLARTQWTDAQFLAEYAEQKRREAAGQMAILAQEQKDDPDTEEYVHLHGTDEG